MKKGWKILLIAIGVIFLLLIIWIIVIPLVFCTNIDFDFTNNPEYISCSEDSDCIPRSCGCLNEEGARKFDFWTVFCSIHLGCMDPSSCYCLEGKCGGVYNYREEGFTIETDKEVYSSNEEMRVVIQNNLENSIYYDEPCDNILNIDYYNDGWKGVPSYSSLDCALNLVELKPNESKEYKLPLRMYDFPSENFRYKIKVYYSFSPQPEGVISMPEIEDQILEVYSNEFIIK